jgi:two-component system, response regulator, stage 0 sporulation protein F
MSSILVVDDVEDIRFLCRLVLEGDGHHVLEAASAEDALEILDTERPDGILLDLRLPGMDGWDVLRILRARDVLAHIKVIVCSAHASKSEQSRAESEGAAGFLNKPFPMRELMAIFQPA